MTDSSKKNRVIFLDLIRAFAVIMMVQGHTIDVLLGLQYRSLDSSVYSTWLFNRAITFRTRNSGHSKVKEFSLYLALMSIGGCVNYSVYAFLIARYSMIALYPVFGVAAGSLAGMTINLFTSRFLLFRFGQE